MKNKLCILIAMLGFAGILSVQSQMLTPVVISSSGGFATSSNVMLSYTIAEMTMVQTAVSSGNILTQGFQQPEMLFVSVPENPDLSGDLHIYPNPTNGNFTLNYLSQRNSETNIQIYDLTGQLVLKRQVSLNEGINTIHFNIGNFSQGIYLLGFPVENAKGEKTTVYQKINLIY